MIVWGIQWDSSGIFKAHTCYVEDLWSSCIYLGFFFTQGCQGDLFFSFCLHIRLIFTANFGCPTKIYCSIHLKYTNIINHNEKKSQHSWIYCLETCSITADNMNKHQNKQENWPFAADLCCEITTFCPLWLYLALYPYIHVCHYSRIFLSILWLGFLSDSDLVQSILFWSNECSTESGETTKRWPTK